MASMTTRCGQCQQTIRFAADNAGKRAKCPNCGTVVKLTDQTLPSPAQPPPAPQQQQALPPFPAAPQYPPPQYAAPQAPPPGTWRCPYCQGTAGLYWTSKISGAGWAVAIVMFLLLCWPLFWIGFLIKEQHSYCNTCNAQLS